MDFINHPISQSLIKKILYNGEEREVCPYQIYNVDILHKFRGETTLPMECGNYFETQCIGSGASGQRTDDLPRKLLTKTQETENRVLGRQGKALVKGNKRSDHLRIDEQILRFKSLCSKYQVMITDTNTQIPIIIPWEKDEKILLTMQLDIFPTPIFYKRKLSVAIIDLKLTADLNSSYGEYCYATPEHLDLIQGKMYHYGVRNINRDLNPHLSNVLTPEVENMIKHEGLFFLWIFNYKKTTLEDKFIEVIWDKTKEAELHESIRKTVSVIEMFEAQAWPVQPSYNRCKHCPIKECEGREYYEAI